MKYQIITALIALTTVICLPVDEPLKRDIRLSKWESISAIDKQKNDDGAKQLQDFPFKNFFPFPTFAPFRTFPPFPTFAPFQTFPPFPTFGPFPTFAPFKPAPGSVWHSVMNNGTHTISMWSNGTSIIIKNNP